MPFQPANWLKNSHLQTLWPFFFRSKPKPVFNRERLELPDGDFIDVDWLTDGNSQTKELAILIHGLQGSSNSHYIRGISQSLVQSNHRVAVMNFRGRSGQMNRLPLFGHAGFTDDIDYLVKKVKTREPNTNIKLVSVSLGASMMLNWLAKIPQSIDLVSCAVAVSSPFDLNESAIRINTGFSKVYQHYLISSLKQSTTDKLALMQLPSILPNWRKSKTFFEFDDAVTSRLHGFEDVHDYYTQSSTRKKLISIETPLLLIQSRDDPFMSQRGLPDKTELNNKTEFEIYDHGGHVGFVGARHFMPHYWLDQRITRYLSQY